MNKMKLLRTATKLAAPHLASMGLGRKKSPLQRVTSGVGGTALKGLGAAAVAVPLGMWLGRRMSDRG